MYTIEQITALLREPFQPNEVKWKPQAVKESKALAVAFIDARTVERRLDSVMSLDGWEDDYQVMENGGVICRLKLRIGNAWVQRCDVGSPSEQPDEGDRTKAAFSDALKRAAVKFGVGRYLYRLPLQWVDYDPKARKFVKVPTLPPWALPQQPKDPPKAEQDVAVKTEATNGSAITMDQARELTAMIRANGIDLQRFMHHFRITRFGELDAKRWKEYIALATAPQSILKSKPSEQPAA